MKRMLALLCCMVLFAALPASAQVIPASEYDEGYFEFTGIYAREAVVLCETLSVRGEPSFSAPVDTTFVAGEPFVTDRSQDGWLHISYLDATREGWVRGEYVLICPSYLVLNGETPAFAYGDAAAPRVALLEKDTRLPIIHSDENWFVVSLRGASAWISRDDVKE